MANFVVFEAIYANLFELIQARRIRVELTIVDHKSKGKKSRRGKENEACEKIAQGAKFSNSTKIASSICDFWPLLTSG